MTDLIATARAYSNIAFIKYWGNQDHDLRLPANGSISMNLQGVQTTTTVHFSPEFSADHLVLNDTPAADAARQRVAAHLDHIRRYARVDRFAQVVSRNNFPMGAGIASSASAFAALTVAAAAALQLDLDDRTLSRIARLGSGSASRSIPGGFVEWFTGHDHDSSYAESIAPAAHWDLIDLIAVVSQEHKAIGSTGGHRLAPTSPLQAARVADASRRLDRCRQAIHARDFDTFASVVEQDTLLMHAVMMTSQPTLIYWHPPTLAIIQAVQSWRQEGLNVCFTIDAGPNVHVITTSQDAPAVQSRLASLPGIDEIISAPPGGPAELLDEHLIAR